MRVGGREDDVDYCCAFSHAFFPFRIYDGEKTHLDKEV